MIDPHHPYPARPVTGDDSALVLNHAADQLVMLRSPMWHGDALAQLHAVASLIAEAHKQLPTLVADARDQQHTWKEIARQLRRSRLAVIALHAGRTARRRTPLDPD
jgi:hypothetical protein